MDTDILVGLVKMAGTVDGNRGTGRTTLMLNAAVATVNAGLPVCVVAASEHHAQQLKCSVHDLAGPVLEQIRFTSFDRAHRDMLGFRGVVFRDHYADESEARSLAVRVSELERQLVAAREKLRMMGVL